MKKELLIKYIDAWDGIERYKKSGFHYFEEKKIVSGSIQNMDLKFKTEINIHSIEGIKDELEILKKEITDVVRKKEEAEKFLSEECHCNHEVVISNIDTGTNHYTDTCVLCGTKFLNSTIHDYGYSMDTIVRNNKKHIVFEGKTMVGEGGWGGDYWYVTHHEIKKIRELIKTIVNNNNSEDIDIVQEIRKLNIEHTIINESQNKTLLLMIVGSNKFYINDHDYISSDYFKSFDKVINYFKDIYGTVINVIGDEDLIKKTDRIPNQLLKDECKDLSDINNDLNWNKDIPYNLIINLGNFSTYDIINNRIIPTKFNLNLEEKFINTPIFDINDIDLTELDISIDDTIGEKAKSLIKVKEIYE